jgi:hypothetical protein
MGKQTEFVRNPHAAKGDEISLAETMHVIAVADTHSLNILKRSARNSTGRDHRLETDAQRLARLQD